MCIRPLPCLFGCLAAFAASGFLTLAPAARAAVTLTTVTSFNGANGSEPFYGNLTLDSQGNLYGTTYLGGSSGNGTIFEIKSGTNTITTLASFNRTNGSEPDGALALDSHGDLFGTTEVGGSGYGTVFEIASGSNTITTLASFNGINGESPQAGLTLDRQGNLFGTTGGGGSGRYGTVFEIASGTNTITTLASFNRTNGATPYAGLILDSQGNFFGTTYEGGSSLSGTVFEIKSGTNTITTLASFNGTNGESPYAGLTLDSQGDLFGTTGGGGSSGYGTVFEITGSSLAGGSPALITLASFNGANGVGPLADLTLDGSGNLFGTTEVGGSGYGTVFEIASGTNTITTLASFNGTNGATPLGGMTLDAYGNLFGTTVHGGDANGDGTVFEVSGAATPPVTPTTHTQLLWNNVSGQAVLWDVNPNGTFTSILYGPFPGWTAEAVAEAPDGSDWLLWTSTSGQIALWHVTALTANGYTATQYGPYTGYSAVSLSVGSDGNPRLLWDAANGTALLWTINAATGAFTYVSYGPFPGWTANKVASGATVTDLLWNNTNGMADGWRIASNGSITTAAFGPYSGYGGFTAVGLSVGPNDGAHLLWDSANGVEALWSVDFTTGAFTATPYGPLSGYAARAIATGPDNGTRLLWDNANGQASLWDVTGSGYTATQYGPYTGWTAVALSAGP